MKIKNHSEQSLLELAATNAANEEGFSPMNSGDAAATSRKPAWSPYEVWRTRVKTSALRRPAQTA